ncbi:MAG TPA: hypothetical protein VGI56_12270 [Galbitalea sp.]
MRIRAIFAATAVGVAAILVLAGCSASSGYHRTDAKADVATWVHDAESSAAPRQSKVKADYFIACDADHAYFVTTWQWRTIAELTLPKSRQAEAISEIKSAFEASRWKSETNGDVLTLTGPLTDDGRAQIIVQPDDQSGLSVIVTSACYS